MVLKHLLKHLLFLHVPGGTPVAAATPHSAALVTQATNSLEVVSLVTGRMAMGVEWKNWLVQLNHRKRNQPIKHCIHLSPLTRKTKPLPPP
jgi:hypothetical protein